MGKADNLLNKISECQRELAKIQSNCIHTKKEIKFINQKEGLRWVCKECKLLVGWPTQFECDKWSNK
tara:strand:+ start:1754 stop:1954 length:201 start_codon:yes stop_codon:yes gene_type:complete